MTAALLLLVPATATLGVVLYTPIVVNITVITAAVGFPGTRALTALMVLACVYLLCWDYDRLKGLLPARRRGPRAVGRREYAAEAAAWGAAGAAGAAGAYGVDLGTLGTRLGPAGLLALGLAGGAAFGLVLAWHLRQTAALLLPGPRSGPVRAGRIGHSALPLSLLIFAAAPTAQAQGPPADSARVLLDTALDLMESQGLHTSRVDWPAVRAQAYAEAAGARTPAGAHDAIRHALTALGDGHSFLLTARDARSFSGTTVGETPEPLRPVGRVLHGDASGPVGYVHVPFFMGSDRAAFADSVLAVVRRVDAARPARWVVDVRGNPGGNIWPMLAGLAPLLGDGGVGGWQGADGSTEWVAIDGPAAVAVLSRPGAPVAVLTDSVTASSGEGPALAFEGRPLSRRFGTPTAGLSTANNGTALLDGSVLVVTTAVMTDRTGRPYGVPVVPDVVVPDVVVADDPSTPTDEALEAALTWLLTLDAP